MIAKVINNAILIIMNTLMAAFIYGGTAYVVFWLDRSPWWFVLAVFVHMLSVHNFGETKGKSQ